MKLGIYVHNICSLMVYSDYVMICVYMCTLMIYDDVCDVMQYVYTHIRYEYGS